MNIKFNVKPTPHEFSILMEDTLGEQPGFPPGLPCPHYSGLYRGRLVPPPLSQEGRFPFPRQIFVPFELELRVDIDSTLPSSLYRPLNKVSGDFYRIYEFNVGNETKSWRLYQSSWIVDNPVVTFTAGEPCSAIITGEVHFFNKIRELLNVRIHIAPQLMPGATVTFTRRGSKSPHETYLCQFVSNTFRHTTLEIDVCKSVNIPPILPTYDTNDDRSYPQNLPRRLLSVETAYLEAGIGMTINPVRSIIDDAALPDKNWLPSELHDAMETYFSHYYINNFFTADQWNVWAMLASGIFVQPTFFGELPRPDVVGIMFDTKVKSPERQGCAIFREHSLFHNLPPNGIPTNQAQAYSLKNFLFTYMHEIGHAFNLLHSWEKEFAIPRALGDEYDLSWMNYPQRWALLHGSPTDNIFWQAFPLTYTDAELLHLRHGNRSAVIFGGTPFEQNAALEDMPWVVGQTPIEFTVRGKNFFRFLEPVILEFKIKNVIQDIGFNLPIELDTELGPEYGNVLVHIQRPDGRILVYEPAMHIYREVQLTTLDPGPLGRFSQNVMLSFGKHGHYFDEPGQYRIRVLYRGMANALITSNVHEFRIGQPSSRTQEQDAQDFYSYESGMALYLGGSDSPYLKSGMDCLQRLAIRYKNSPVGAQLSLILAQNLAQPFRYVAEVGYQQMEIGGNEVQVMQTERKERPAKPQEALQYLDRALQQHQNDPAETFQNISYHQASRTKATLLAAIGHKKEAVDELEILISYLKKRGVKNDILKEIDVYKQQI